MKWKERKEFWMKILLLCSLFSSCLSSQEEIHDGIAKIREGTGGQHKREGVEGKEEAVPTKILNLGLVVRKDDLVAKRAVLDAIQDFSPQMNVNLDIIISPSEEEQRTNLKESICQTFLSKSIDTTGKAGKCNLEGGEEAEKGKKEQQVDTTDSVSFPDLLINTDSRISLPMKDVAKILEIPLVSISDEDPGESEREEVRRSMNDATGDQGIVMVKSPARILLESVRDAVQHFSLGSNFLRVLYDKEYAGMKSVLQGMLPNTTVFEFLDKGMMMMEGNDFKKRIRRMRKPKVSSFVVIANTELMANLTEVINENDMFRASYTWFFATKDKRKVKCSHCKHAKLNVIQPMICHLHEYEGKTPGLKMQGSHVKNSRDALPLKDKVDYFFHYDLTRLTLSSLLSSKSVIPHDDDRGTDDVTRHSEEKRSTVERNAGNMKTTASMVSMTSSSFCSILLNFRRKMGSNHPDAESLSSIQSHSTSGSVDSVPDLQHVLFEESRDFHAKYGEFIIASESDWNQVAQRDKASYQDIRMEISRVVYVKDMRKKLKLASWFYSEPTGMMISRAYEEENQDVPASVENSEGGSDASTESPAEGEKGNDTPPETAEEAACSDGHVKADENELIFIVYHHPPFVFVDSTALHVNASMEQLSPLVKNKQEFGQYSTETTESFTPVSDGGNANVDEDSSEDGDGGDHKHNKDVKVYYSGFLIQLLEKIKARYNEKHADNKFPKYRIMMSRLFGPPPNNDKGGKPEEGAEIGGGFGSKAMPKAGESEGKEGEEGKSDDGGDSDGAKASKNFRGIIREVMCQKQKVALMPMTPTPERRLVVDFSEPFFETVSLSIMMKKPILQYHYWKFVTVLEYSVWLCITGAYFFTSVLLWFFDRSSPYSYRNDPERYKHDIEKRYFTLKESLWFCITSLTPQGGGEAPKALSGRLVAATWWLFGFIVIASYTANLAAFLTVSRLDHPINNFNELTRQYKIKYSPFEGSSTRTYFERMARIEERFYQVWKDLSLNDEMEEDERANLAVWDYPISDRFTKIWAAMTEASAPVGYNEAIYKVKASSNDSRDGNALVAETLVIDYAIQVHCDLMKVGGEFNPRPNAFAYNKKNTIVKEFDSIIEELKEDGTIERMKEYWWHHNVPTRNCYEHRKLYNGITLKNAAGIFMVISAGIMATLLSLWIENWYYNLRTKSDMMMKAKSDRMLLMPPVDAARKRLGGSRCLIQ